MFFWRGGSGKGGRVVLLQGPAGAGKSLFGWRTLQYYNELQAGGTAGLRMPLVISLPAVKERVASGPTTGSHFLVEGIMDAFPSLRHSMAAMSPEYVNSLPPLPGGCIVLMRVTDTSNVLPPWGVPIVS